MSSERFEYTPAAEKLRQNRDGMLRLFDNHLREKLSENDGYVSEKPLTAYFLLDGTIQIPFNEFSKLPEWLKEYFLDGRISRPPSAHVFSDYNDSLENPDVLASLHDTGNFVGLRGGRFWDFDGSKANHGPDGLEALSLLFENIGIDLEIIKDLNSLEVKNEFEWLAKVSAWENIRNDFCALYYSYKCRNALDTTADPADLAVLDKALTYISNKYFDSILMIDSKNDEGLNEVALVSQYAEDLENSLTELISQEDLQSYDLLRSHREVSNPLSLLQAFRLVYNIDSKTGDLEYSKDYKDADAIIAPLYGGIDLVFAVRYAMTDGKAFIEELMQTELKDAERHVKVLPVLSKIGSKGVVRSQMSSANNVIPSLGTDRPVNGREKQWLAKEIPDAERLLVIDDSLATGKSSAIFSEWLSSALDREVETRLRVIYVNLRWAEIQRITVEDLMNTDPLTQTPITRNMNAEKVAYKFGSRFIPDAVSSGLLLKTSRTFLELNEASQALMKMHEVGIIDGVGFDFDDTINTRNVDSKQRRDMINRAVVELLNENGVTISPKDYAQINRTTLDSERKKSAKDASYPINTTDCNKSILLAIGLSDEETINVLAEAMTRIELEIDKEVMEANQGLIDGLEQLKKQGVPLGIFSNSHYTPDQLMELLETIGLSQYFEKEFVVASSQVGVAQKPDAAAIKSLAKAMGIQVKRMAYVGNSFSADVVGSTRSGAIAIHVPKETDVESKAEIQKINRWRENLNNV